MPTSKTHPVRIVADQTKPGLSKAQQQFNTLIKKIDQHKQRLGLWAEHAVASRLLRGGAPAVNRQEVISGHHTIFSNPLEAHHA